LARAIEGWPGMHCTVTEGVEPIAGSFPILRLGIGSPPLGEEAAQQGGGLLLCDSAIDVRPVMAGG
jgi:hypothetical protein